MAKIIFVGVKLANIASFFFKQRTEDEKRGKIRGKKQKGKEKEKKKRRENDQANKER